MSEPMAVTTQAAADGYREKAMEQQGLRRRDFTPRTAVAGVAAAAGFKVIDTNKGSAEAPRYRSRLACTEVRHIEVEPIFSASLPLETLRILVSVACQEDVFRVEDPFLISSQM